LPPNKSWPIQRVDSTQLNLIMKPHRGTLILVLGILSLVVCAPLGIAAWVMGNGDLKQIDAGTMDPSGRSLTNAGRICGMIGTILLALGALAVIAALAMGVLGAVVSQH
jgi:hypothetical protein